MVGPLNYKPVPVPLLNVCIVYILDLDKGCLRQMASYLSQVPLYVCFTFSFSTTAHQEQVRESMSVCPPPTSTLLYPVLLLSWGVKWGIDGYFKMVRGIGKCGVDQQVASAVLN